MIENKNAFMASLIRQYNRLVKGEHFGRETANGLKMAISFLGSVECDTLTEQQIGHACRLTTYRGTISDHRKLFTN